MTTGKIDNKKIQEALKASGKDHAGLIDEKTRAALKAFQETIIDPNE